MSTYRLLYQPPGSALDEQWSLRLNDVGLRAGEIYSVLGPSQPELSALKDRFAASGQRRPVSFAPTASGMSGFDDPTAALHALRAEIAATEQNDTVRQAYLMRIDELIANVALLEAAKAGDHRAFASLNETVYGHIDQSAVKGATRWLRSAASSVAERPDEGYADIAQAALRSLDEIGEPARAAAVMIPDVSLFDTLRATHDRPGGYFAQLLDGIPALSEETVIARTGDPVLAQVLKNIGSDYSIVDSPTNLWGVLHSQGAVLRPADYRLRRKDFMALVVHEIGSHTLEHSNGVNSRLKLLATGLDRYEHLNEGRAYLREQLLGATPDAITYQPSWQYHMLIYLAIWLAAEKSYDMSALYRTVLPLTRLLEIRRRPDVSDVTPAAENSTWNVLVRALKGTDGIHGAYLKDTVYVQGAIRCWQAAAVAPELILCGDGGKFDFTRPDHRAIARLAGAQGLPDESSLTDSFMADLISS